MEAAMLQRAEVIQGFAEALSPVGGDWDPHPGAYKASWAARLSNLRVGRARKKRATATVSNYTYYARWVEYGSERVSGQHVLLRAAQLGGRDG